MRARIRQSALIPAGLALTLASLGGCVIGDPEGGNRASTDKHVYVSYYWAPKTISLIDTRNDEVLWTYEIPVGKKLKIQFENSRNRLSDQIMRWGVGEPDGRFIRLDNQMPVPSQHARKLDWVLRPVPEYPPDAAASTEGG